MALRLMALRLVALRLREAGRRRALGGPSPQPAQGRSWWQRADGHCRHFSARRRFLCSPSVGRPHEGCPPETALSLRNWAVLIEHKGCPDLHPLDCTHPRAPRGHEIGPHTQEIELYVMMPGRSWAMLAMGRGKVFEELPCRRAAK